MIKISVVIPLYNKVDFIKRALSSVLEQTYENFEIIIVNDGSTDGSEKIVEGYNDVRIKLLHRPYPSGVSVARNFGIKHSSADLIAFIDADDKWNENFLGTIVRLRKKHPKAGAYSTAFIEKRSNKCKKPIFWFIPRGEEWEGIIPDYFKSCIYGASPVCSSAVAIPKKIFSDVGFFPEGIKRGEDQDMWARIALNYDIAFSQYVGAIYYKGIQRSGVKKNKCLEGYRVVESLEAALKKKKICPKKAKYIKEYANKFILGSAAQCIKAGEIELAKKHLNKCHTERFLGRKLFLIFSAFLYSNKQRLLL
ncbi:glycosyltransferase [bacterium]|nr:glycosyltransferase [bacterium]